jgi:hypothetical protein
MKSKRSHEGYLLIDNRNAPGLTLEEAAKLGKAHVPGLAGEALVEGATITCHHCQRVLFINRQRVRARAYCPKCDHYICDWCELERARTGGACRPMKQILDEQQEKAARDEQRARLGLILPPT